MAEHRTKWQSIQSKYTKVYTPTSLRKMVTFILFGQSQFRMSLIQPNSEKISLSRNADSVLIVLRIYISQYVQYLFINQSLNKVRTAKILTSIRLWDVCCISCAPASNANLVLHKFLDSIVDNIETS